MSDGVRSAARRVVAVLSLTAMVGLAACGDDAGSKKEGTPGSATTSRASAPSGSGSDATAVSPGGDGNTTVVTRQKDTPEMLAWLETARPVLDERFAAVDELNGLLTGGPPDGLTLFCLGQAEAVGTARSVVTPVPNPSVDGLVTAYLAAQDRLFASCSPGTPEAIVATTPIAQEATTLQRTLQAELLEYGA